MAAAGSAAPVSPVPHSTIMHCPTSSTSAVTLLTFPRVFGEIPSSSFRHEERLTLAGGGGCGAEAMVLLSSGSQVSLTPARDDGGVRYALRHSGSLTMQQEPRPMPTLVI